MSAAAKKPIEPQGEASVGDVTDLLDPATQKKLEAKGEKPHNIGAPTANTPEISAAAEAEAATKTGEVDPQSAILEKNRKATQAQIASALKKEDAANDDKEKPESPAAPHAAEDHAKAAHSKELETPAHAVEHAAPHDGTHNGGSHEKKGLWHETKFFFSSLLTTLGRLTRTAGITTDTVTQLAAGVPKWYRSHAKPVGAIASTIADYTPGPIKKGINWLLSKFGLDEKIKKPIARKYSKKLETKHPEH